MFATCALLAAGDGWSNADRKTSLPCAATRNERAPPYYRPGAPIRSRVGQGYVLTGVVRAAGSCRPLGRARVEFFLTNPSGTYDSQHRGTVIASAAGAYRISSNFPGRFHGRPPHIHIRASAPGFSPVMTQHYPRTGTRSGTFNVHLRRLL